MHKEFDYELSIEKYDIESKSSLPKILEILNDTDGLMTDNSDNMLFFGFETEMKQLNCCNQLYKIGIFSDIWIKGVKK